MIFQSFEKEMDPLFSKLEFSLSNNGLCNSFPSGSEEKDFKILSRFFSSPELNSEVSFSSIRLPIYNIFNQTWRKASLGEGGIKGKTLFKVEIIMKQQKYVEEIEKSPSP